MGLAAVSNFQGSFDVSESGAESLHSFSPVFPYLSRNCLAEREKREKKKDFPRETLSSRLRRGLPQHATVRSSAHSFTLTNCSVNLGAGLPALSPSRNPIQSPRSESARHPRLFTHSSSFDIFLLPGSQAGTMDRHPAPRLC